MGEQGGVEQLTRTEVDMSLLGRVKRGVVAFTPLPIAERILPYKRAVFRAAGVTEPAPAAAQARTRLYIGPVNSAGQAYAWARAAERLPGVAAANFMYRNGGDTFAYPADHAVDTAYFVQNARWQRAQRRAVTRGFTHALLESGRPVFGGGEDPTGDIAALRARGVQVALLFHGSDIRTPSVHARSEPDSPFRDGGYPDQDRLERTAARNAALIRSARLPVFVSTPDLLSFVPEATWLPVAVDPESWRAAEPTLQRRRPIVVHAPSRAGLKGTALVSPIARRLHEEGVIEYRELHGVPAADMPGVYGQADIVLDQFSLGIYGVAACEALAAGRLVVSHVSDEVRTRVRAWTGHELPVLEACASTVEDTLRAIADDPAPIRALAARGPGFVREIHDGRRSAAALRGFLGVREDPA